MHRHNEARLREIAAEHADVAPKWFGSEGIDADQRQPALLLGDGYTAARFFYDMVAPSLDGIVEPPMPDGIELRPVTRDQYRTIWLAVAEAFRDHWGEQRVDRGGLGPLRRRPDNADPQLLAHRLGRRRGRRAWSRPPCRSRRTSATAARASTSPGSPCGGRGAGAGWPARCSPASLVAAREAGFTSASLGVDTDSPTGATAPVPSPSGFAARRRRSPAYASRLLESARRGLVPHSASARRCQARASRVS